MSEQREDPGVRIEVNNASHALKQFLEELDIEFEPISHDHKDCIKHIGEVAEALRRGDFRGWVPYFFPAWYEFENGSFDGIITILTSRVIEHKQAEKLADLMYNQGAEHPEDVEAGFTKIASKAQVAFWKVVADELYEATSGNFDPIDAARFDRACEEAVRIWYEYNCITEQ